MADSRLSNRLSRAGSRSGTQAEQFSAPWGKSASDGSWHSVIGHSLDVAVVARRLMGRPVLRSRLSAAFGCPLVEGQLDRLAVVAGIHDGGKCLAGFQAKRTHKLPIGQGHVAEFLATLQASQRVKDAVGLTRLATWFHDPDAALMAALCHHGSPVSLPYIGQCLHEVSSQLATTIYGHDPITEIRRLATALMAAFPGARDHAPSLDFPSPAQHLFAGIVMTADWMASAPARFPYLDGEEQQRSDRADRLLQATGWSGWSSGAAPLALLGGRRPRPVQAVIQAISPDGRLVVIEAPTGTGKTEAALIHAVQLVNLGLVDGLYFAVPSRSAATELHERIARTMTAIHPALSGKVVRAVPGMLDTDPAQDMHDEADRSWAVQAPKTVFAAPVAVGTIDQAMLSILRVRHSWLRAACLSRQLLVLDEVHASDPYQAEIVSTLVDRHLDLGGYVLAMSATLGETALARLQHRERRLFDESIAISYPAIRTSRTLPVGAPTVRRVAIILSGLEECLAAASAAARAGQCVLLIRSTVADAIETWKRLSQAGVETMLHHSRYALHDRSILDRRLMDVMGPGGSRGGLVAVTTQTAEQSLDIDADLLITDACPADVLLQRLGRLHRHREGTHPVALMIDPGDLTTYLAADGRVRGRQQQGWAWVYNNLLAVGQTIDWIVRNESITVPHDSRALVERATHADHLRGEAERLGGAWIRLWERLYSDESRQRQLADAGLVDWHRDYAEAVVNERIATRLGEGTIDIEVHLVSPFDRTPISRIPVPRRWLKDIPTTADVTSEGNEIVIGNDRFFYDAAGLSRHGEPRRGDTENNH